MKRVTLIIIALTFVFTAEAQLYGYKWRFGVSTGIANYYGDIRPFELDNFENFTKLYQRNDAYSERLSYQLSLEYALGKSVGLMLTAGTYQFGSGDRYIQPNNTLLTGNSSFDRALNFQTELHDAGLSLVFKPDNNWLLSGKSFLAPYFTLGFGVQQFKVYGDLLDESGNRYDYNNPDILPNGTFETNLSQLNTELPQGYDQRAFYANLGLGLRFRITKSIEIFAQSDFKRSSSDYLDDVSGKYRNSYDNSLQAYAAKPGTNVVTAENPYRGMKNGDPDWYIYHGIGLKFSFGANKKTFSPPVISQRYTYEPMEQLPEIAEKDSVEKDSTVIQSIDHLPQNNIVNNYFTVIQLPSNQTGWSSHTKPVIDSAQAESIQAQKDSLLNGRDSLNIAYENNEAELIDLTVARQLLELDSTASEEMDSIKMQTIQSAQTALDSSKVGITNKLKENQFKLDSLDNVLMRLSPTGYLPSEIDTAAIMQELVIYPGQVSRILFNTNPAVLSIDSAHRPVYSSTTSDSTKVYASPDMMTREQFDTEIKQITSGMLTAQATRDSAMMMAFATRNQAYLTESTRESVPQEISINTEAIDNKTARRLEKDRKREERLEKKNNRLLKDALLVGGTAATTAAITNSGDKKKEAAAAANDSTLRARIAMDSVIIDSLSNLKPQVDTVKVVETVNLVEEKQIQSYFDQSKIEVYFAINESTLSDKELSKLEPVATYMNKNSEVKLELIGFADNTGSIPYNLTLTQKRVDSVRNKFIEEYKIDPSRIQQSEGGLIIRGKSKGSVESDRKVEIRILMK